MNIVLFKWVWIYPKIFPQLEKMTSSSLRPVTVFCKSASLADAQQFLWIIWQHCLGYIPLFALASVSAAWKSVTHISKVYICPALWFPSKSFRWGGRDHKNSCPEKPQIPCSSATMTLLHQSNFFLSWLCLTDNSTRCHCAPHKNKQFWAVSRDMDVLMFFLLAISITGFA